MPSTLLGKQLGLPNGWSISVGHASAPAAACSAPQKPEHTSPPIRVLCHGASCTVRCSSAPAGSSTAVVQQQQSHRRVSLMIEQLSTYARTVPQTVSRCKPISSQKLP
jgi:hypothetical protein